MCNIFIFFYPLANTPKLFIWEYRVGLRTVALHRLNKINSFISISYLTKLKTRFIDITIFLRYAYLSIVFQYRTTLVPKRFGKKLIYYTVNSVYSSIIFYRAGLIFSENTLKLLYRSCYYCKICWS